MLFKQNVERHVRISLKKYLKTIKHFKVSNSRLIGSKIIVKNYKSLHWCVLTGLYSNNKVMLFKLKNK